MIVSIFVILWVIMIFVSFKVLLSFLISLIKMFIEIGFWFVNGLLYIIKLGFNVIVCVSVVCCVILFDNLFGINEVVFFKLIVCSFNVIVVVIMFFESWVCFFNGNVMLLNIFMLVNSVLFWNNMFMWWWVWYSFCWFMVIIELLLNFMFFLLGISCLLIKCSNVVLFILFGFIIVVILFFGICSDILLYISCLVCWKVRLFILIKWFIVLLWLIFEWLNLVIVEILMYFYSY